MSESKGWRGKVAAGFIIYRRTEGPAEYLQLKASYGTKHWTPPKGHVDPGESEYETALRETKEEAGLDPEQFDVVPDYKKELNYLVGGKDKRVCYWLAKVKDSNVKIALSDEHTELDWSPLDKAKELAGYPDMQQLLDEVDAYIQANKL